MELHSNGRTMTTIIAIAFFGWRIYADRQARQERAEGVAATLEMRARITNIEEALRATPFVKFKHLDQK